MQRLGIVSLANGETSRAINIMVSREHSYSLGWHAARSIFSNDNTSPMQAGAMETPTAPADTTNTTNQLLQVVLRQQQLLAQAGLLPARMEQVSHV